MEEVKSHPTNITGAIFGGLPGQTAYYFSAKTYFEAGGDREKLWSFLQQKTTSRNKTHLPAIRQYTLKYDEINAYTAFAINNPQYGVGGGEMIYIEDYQNLVLPVREIQNHSQFETPVHGLKMILDFELSLGNEIDFIDQEKRLNGIYLKRPLHLSEIDNKKFQVPPSIEFFSSSENKFCASEIGVLCSETKQFLSGPLETKQH